MAAEYSVSRDHSFKPNCWQLKYVQQPHYHLSNLLMLEALVFPHGINGHTKQGIKILRACLGRFSPKDSNPRFHFSIGLSNSNRLACFCDYNPKDYDPKNGPIL